MLSGVIRNGTLADLAQPFEEALQLVSCRFGQAGVHKSNHRLWLLLRTRSGGAAVTLQRLSTKPEPTAPT
jgi:hypothetical protein